MANLDNLPPLLRARGFTVHETAGWITRGFRNQDMQAIAGVLWHHTATPRHLYNNNPAPTVGVCLNGTNGVSGPLCNIVFDRNGHVWMIATGVANHAGAGSAHGIPTNMGNHYLIGIEMESSGVAPWDWTPAQLEIAPRLGAALEEIYLMGLPEDRRLQLGHMEYSSEGKIDPAGWPGGMNGFRATVNAHLGNAVAPAPAPAAPKPAPAPAPAPGKTNYVPDLHWEVDPGDTLSKIAAEFKCSVAELAKFNDLKNPNVLRVGEWIWPPRGYCTWIVEPGETVSSIIRWARSVGYNSLTVDKVCFANGMNNPNVMPPLGRRMLIP